MRFGVGLVGLLVVLAIVAVLAKRQGSMTQALQHPAGAAAPGGAAPANVREQGQQIQEQFKQQLDAAMQQRTMPEDAQ